MHHAGEGGGMAAGGMAVYVEKKAARVEGGMARMAGGIAWKYMRLKRRGGCTATGVEPRAMSARYMAWRRQAKDGNEEEVVEGGGMRSACAQKKNERAAARARQRANRARNQVGAQNGTQQMRGAAGGARGRQKARRQKREKRKARRKARREKREEP